MTTHKGISTNIKLFRLDMDFKISTLKRKSMYITYRLAELTNFKKVDLHGLTLEESQEVVILVIDQILRSLSRSNSKRYDLEIVTGKGLHSDGDPVLHPRIKEFLQKEGYKPKSSKDEGKIEVAIIN